MNIQYPDVERLQWVSLPSLHHCSQQSEYDLCSHTTPCDLVFIRHNGEHELLNYSGYHKVIVGTD